MASEKNENSNLARLGHLKKYPGLSSETFKNSVREGTFFYGSL